MKKTSKINFKDFKKGDEVIITVFDEDEGELKNISANITKISYEKKILCFEDDTTGYECTFSEIKEMKKQTEDTSEQNKTAEKIMQKLRNLGDDAFEKVPSFQSSGKVFTVPVQRNGEWQLVNGTTLKNDIIINEDEEHQFHVITVGISPCQTLSRLGIIVSL